MTDLIFPEWYADYTKPREISPRGFAFLLTRPEAVQKLYLRFPPGCVCRIKATGQVGCAVGIVAGDTNFPTITWNAKPHQKTGTEFMPDDLEVVGFFHGIDEAVVQSILDAGRTAEIKPRDKSVGRNDACPCGAVVDGTDRRKKFKNCCMHLGAVAPKPGEESRN